MTIYIVIFIERIERYVYRCHFQFCICYKLFPSYILHFSSLFHSEGEPAHKTGKGSSLSWPQHQGQESKPGFTTRRHSITDEQSLPHCGRHFARFTFSSSRLSISVSHALHSGRSNADWHADFLPQDWGWQVHYWHVSEHPGVQLPSTQRQIKRIKSLHHQGYLQFLIAKSRFFSRQEKHGESCFGAGAEPHCVAQSCSRTYKMHKARREQARRHRSPWRVKEAKSLWTLLAGIIWKKRQELQNIKIHSESQPPRKPWGRTGWQRVCRNRRRISPPSVIPCMD